MAGKVKGITIQFEADTTGLNTALREIQKQTRGVQSSLKAVDKALKLDPTNTELIAQKHTLLKQRVEASKKKIEQLEDVQKQLDAKGVDKCSQEYMEVTRKIEQAKQEAKQFNKELSKINSVKVEQLAAKWQKAGDKMTAAGKAITPLSAATGAALTGAVSAATSFQAEFSKVQAMTGATGDELEALHDKAIELGNGKFGVSEITAGMTELATAGWKAQDIISGLQGITQFATSGNIDLSTAIGITTTTLAQFNMDASEATTVADLFATAQANSNVTAEQLGNALEYAGSTASAMGFSLEDTTEALGLMANAGVRGTKGGTALRNIMLAMGDDIKLTGKNLGDYTVKTTNADGTMRSLSDILMDCRGAFSKMSDSEKAAAAKALVGKSAMSGFLGIMNSSDKDIAKLSDSLDNSAGSSEDMAEIMGNTLSGSLNRMKNSIIALGTTIGENLTPYIKTVADWIQKLAVKFENLPDSAQQVITGIGLFITALAPVLLIGGKIAGSISSVIGAFSSLSGAFASIGGLSGILSSVGSVASAALGAISAPVLAVVGVIALLVAAFVHLYKNNEDFRNKVNEIWGSIKKLFLDFLESMKAVFEPAKGIIEGFKEAFKGFGDYAKQIFGWFSEFMGPLFLGAFESVKTAISGSLDGILGIFQVFAGIFRDDWSEVWQGIKNIVKGVMNFILAFFGTSLGSLKNKITSAWAMIKNSTSNAWQAVKEKITKPFEAAKNKIKGIIDKIKGWFPIKLGNIFKGLKLPSFYLSSETKNYGKLGKVTIPKTMGVTWHKNGGIFKNPTLLGNGHGVGEAGAEAVLPLTELWKQMETMMNRMGDNIVNGFITASALQGGNGTPGEIRIVNYLYPGGAKCGESIVNLYDTYKPRLG